MKGDWRLKAPRDIRATATTKGYITKPKFHEYGLHFIKHLKFDGMTDRCNLLIVNGSETRLYNLHLYEAMSANNNSITHLLLAAGP